MTDVPEDVRTVLTQLFEEARNAFEAGDIETGRSAVESAESVVTSKLPDGELRDQFSHGCDRIESLVEEDEIEVVTAYIEAMERRLDEAA